MNRPLLLNFAIILIVFAACGSLDLAFVNEVKTFEPKWMDLSEKVSYIDRNLNATYKRYDGDYEAVDRAANNKRTVSDEFFSLKSQYTAMVKDRDELKVRFDVQKEQFTGIAYAFNEWQVKLMKKKLSTDKAQQDLLEYRAQYDELEAEISKLQSEIIANIEEHNALMRRMVQMLDIYNNYDIDVR